MIVIIVLLAFLSAGSMGLAVFFFNKYNKVSNQFSDIEKKYNDTSSLLTIADGKTEELSNELEKLNQDHSSLLTENLSLNEDLDKFSKQYEDIQLEKNSIEEDLLKAERKIVDLVARPDVILKELANNESNNASALWQLELQRSERSWRNSVAVNPVSDISPFETSDNKAKLVVEVEAAALREDVGANIEIDWKAKPIEDPATSHLVVRIAQELLALAAKSRSKSKLQVTGKKNLKLTFTQVDNSEINFIPPIDLVRNETIDITDKNGLTITVKS